MDNHKGYATPGDGIGMDVQVLEFNYDAANVSDMESQISNYLQHHEVQDVQVTQWENRLLVFFFSEE